MKVLIDNQIFEQQKFGGISRYFNMLERDNNSLQKMELFVPQIQQKKNFYQKIHSKLNRIPLKDKPIILNRYDFYNAQLRNMDFDIFHPTYYDNYFLNSLKKPFVLTVYDMIHEIYAEYFGNSMDSFYKQKLCNAATKIIAISHSTKKDLIDIFNIPEEKIEVIHLATDFESIDSEEPQFDLNRPYILFTGNRSIYKNFFTFLIAVSPILKKHKDLHLICTGPGFTAIENRWIDELKLENKVMSFFCQSDGELVHLYKNAECFVFPSLYEGFGFPLLEAFACECPVISSPGGSLKEIAGNAAVYFDPKNISEMRQVINTVLLDEGLKKELVAAGKKRLNDFSWEKCRQQTMDLYSQVLTKPYV